MGKIIRIAFAMLFLSVTLHAQDEEKADDKVKVMEIYGFIMADAGHNFMQTDPNWFDVLRVTKLPAYENQYGTDGNTFFSVRQTRLGFKNYFQTPKGELKTQFEFEMFGTGVDAGQTTIRLRHAYAEIGHWGFGQYWSPFMDIDVFPNTVEYWGPPGMAFFRNVQVRYMPIQGDSRLTLALERPGASSDQGIYGDRIELKGVAPRFAYPDFSAEYRYGGDWGYVELAGIIRSMVWKDLNTDTFDLSGSAVGWGGSFSTNLKFGGAKKDRTVFRGQVLYGEGIENYMNDAPADVGIKNNFGNARTPIVGVALPVLGISAFIDHMWNDSKTFSSSLGYSLVQITNSDAQTPDAFREGHYAIANLMWYPFPNGMMAVEGQWGNRQNFSDGWSYSAFKLQFSFKFNFSKSFYVRKS